MFTYAFLLMSLDLVECASRASARNKKPPAMRVGDKNYGYTLSGMDRDSMPDFFIQKRGHLLSPRYTINSPQKS